MVCVYKISFQKITKLQSYSLSSIRIYNIVTHNKNVVKRSIWLVKNPTFYV